MNIITKIEKARFLATEHDIELMARERQDSLDAGAKATGTYLKVLTALTAHEIGGRTALLSRRRGKLALSLRPEEVADHLNVLESINSRCYAAVCKAVITPDIERKDDLPQSEQTRRALERNRRTNYARTAMSALRAYVQAGRDVRDLEPSEVTKGKLNEITETYAPPTRTVSTARLLRAATRAGARIVAEAEELAGIDPAQAERLLSALVDQLSETLEKIKAGELPASSEDMGTTTIITQNVRGAALRRAA